jgi:hypothetical protein
VTRHRIAVVVLAGGLAWAGCGGGDRGSSDPGADAALEAPQAASGITQRARIHPSLPEFAFRLVADVPAGDTVTVTGIEIRRGTMAAPVQVIGGLDTETPAREDAPPLDVLDMNFDGYADIRLAESQPAGPNVPYLNWLFNPASGRFDENAALNALTSPQFDEATREVRSEWRDGPARYGADVYVFRGNGELTPVRKELKEFTAPGRYTFQVQTFVDGAWRVTGQRQGTEP